MKRFNINLALVCLVTLLISPSFAKTVPQSQTRSVKKKLHHYLEAASAYGFSGQVLVAKKRKILLKKSYGYANRENRKLINRKTAFNIASLTKPFTALTVLTLVDQKRLRLTDEISQIFENVPADKSKITIHQLLSHTAGFRRDVNSRDIKTRDEFVRKILESKLASMPGEKFQYSNIGYRLLAAIVERVSKNSIRDYMSESIFKKAKMRRTGFYQEKRWPNEDIAQGYNEWKKVPPFTEWKKTWKYGSGSMVSTVEDVFRGFRALKEDKLISPRLREKLFSKQTAANRDGVSYGYGWYLTKTKNGEKLIYHGGDNYGYHSELRWFPEKDIVIIVLTNNEAFDYINGGAVLKRGLANNLYRILAGEKHQSPPKPTKKSSENSRKQYTGSYAFPNGSKFVIGSNPGTLTISAEGQKAINLLAGYSSEDAEKYAKATVLTTSIVKHITEGEMEKVKKLLPEGTYNFYIPFLAKGIDKLKAKFGELNKHKVQGTAALPWNPNDYRTNVILSFEKGNANISFGWENGKLYDVTTQTGRPYPLIMPLARVKKNEFSTYEFIQAKSSRISFSIGAREVDQLRIKTSDGEAVAKRVSDQ